MIPADFYRKPSKLLTACSLLMLSACAHQALDKQLAASNEAVEQARASGAAQTDPADFNAAADKLSRANADAKKWHKGEAMRLAEEAQADANLAHAKTESIQTASVAAELAKGNQALRRAIEHANQK